MKADTDRLVRVEGKRACVAILAVQLGANQPYERVGQVGGRVGQRHVEQPRGLEEAAEVVLRTEQKELRFLQRPVAAEPAEDAGAVVQGVRQHTDARFRVRDDATAEERVEGKSHGRPPFRVSDLFSPLLKSTLHSCFNWL